MRFAAARAEAMGLSRSLAWVFGPGGGFEMSVCGVVANTFFKSVGA
jgi:hypothetical protein